MARRVVATAFAHFQVNWQCSKCGTQNSERADLSFDSSTATTPTAESLYHSASKSALANRNAAISRLSHPDVGRRYERLKLNCKCKNCNHAEPWCNPDNSWLVAVSAVLLVLALCTLSIPLGVICISLLAYMIINALVKRKLIRELPEASLPHFSEQTNSLLKEESAPSNDVPAKQTPEDYTEEELKQLPAWKRVEILKAQERKQ